MTTASDTMVMPKTVKRAWPGGMGYYYELRYGGKPRQWVLCEYAPLRGLNSAGAITPAQADTLMKSDNPLAIMTSVLREA